MSIPTFSIPLPIARRTPDAEPAAGADATAAASPCADHGRCDPAACGHAERAVRHCPGSDATTEAPV